MNERDDAIDAVMSALKAAEPSAGFEARMHHALQNAPASHRIWRVPFAWMTAVALLLCAVAIGVGLRGHRQVGPMAVNNVQPTHRVAQRSVVAEPAGTSAPPVPKLRTAKLVRVHQPLPADDEVARTHQNIPPPPLPLTKEEKLVLRMMRKNDLPQLALFSPDDRARSLRDDAERYHEFFAPWPALNGQPYYEQHIVTGDSQ